MDEVALLVLTGMDLVFSGYAKAQVVEDSVRTKLGNPKS